MHAAPIMGRGRLTHHVKDSRVVQPRRARRLQRAKTGIDDGSVSGTATEVTGDSLQNLFSLIAPDAVVLYKRRQ